MLAEEREEIGGLIWVAIRGLCAFILGVTLVYLFAEEVLLWISVDS